MPHGKLDVHVEGAVGIKDTALLGKGNPYCTLTMGTQVYSSPPVNEGGTHPYLNTKFEFTVDRSTQQLQVSIYSKKSLTDDDLLGYCTIFFKDAFYHSHVVPVTAYALTRPSGRPGGHVRLSLSFKSQLRPAPAPGGYARPQPRPAPNQQPRPPGPPPGAYAPPRGHPPAGSYRQPRPPQVGPSQAPYPPQQPQYTEPRRINEESDSSPESSDSDAEGNVTRGPFQAQPQMQYAPRGRGRVGPPPGRGGPRPRPPGPYMNQPVRGPTPPPQQPGNVNNVMGSVFQNLGGMHVGAAAGSILGSDGDGSDWGGDDVSVDGSFGNVETETLEDGHCEESGTVVPSYESYESCEERVVYGETSHQDAAGAPGGGYRPVGYAPPGSGARGRGRAGPPPGALGGPPGRGGHAPMRGRGPIARGGPPPGRGGHAPMRGRGPIVRGGPPPMRGRGPPPAGY